MIKTLMIAGPGSGSIRHICEIARAGRVAVIFHEDTPENARKELEYFNELAKKMLVSKMPELHTMTNYRERLSGGHFTRIFVHESVEVFSDIAKNRPETSLLTLIVPFPIDRPDNIDFDHQEVLDNWSVIGPRSNTLRVVEGDR